MPRPPRNETVQGTPQEEKARWPKAVGAKVRFPSENRPPATRSTDPGRMQIGRKIKIGGCLPWPSEAFILFIPLLQDEENPPEKLPANVRTRTEKSGDRIRHIGSSFRRSPKATATIARPRCRRSRPRPYPPFCIDPAKTDRAVAQRTVVPRPCIDGGPSRGRSKGGRRPGKSLQGASRFAPRQAGPIRGSGRPSPALPRFQPIEPPRTEFAQREVGTTVGLRWGGGSVQLPLDGSGRKKTRILPDEVAKVGEAEHVPCGRAQAPPTCSKMVGPCLVAGFHAEGRSGAVTTAGPWGGEASWPCERR